MKKRIVTTSTICKVCSKEFPGRPDSARRHERGCVAVDKYYSSVGAIPELQWHSFNILTYSDRRKSDQPSGRPVGDDDDIEKEELNFDNIEEEELNCDIAKEEMTLHENISSSSSSSCSSSASSSSGSTSSSSSSSSKAWFVPSEEEVFRWSQQFHTASSGEVEYSPFLHDIDSLTYDYIFNRKDVLFRTEAVRVINLLRSVLDLVYEDIGVQRRIYPSSFEKLKRCSDAFQVAAVEEISREIKESGHGKGKSFISQAARLPSQILFQTFLHPTKSKHVKRIHCLGERGVENSNVVLNNEYLKVLCIPLLRPLSGHEFIYLGDSVTFKTAETNRSGVVVNIFRTMKVLHGCLEVIISDVNEDQIKAVVDLKDVVQVMPDDMAKGRQLLMSGGITSEMEIVSVPLMLFSDDMNAGRTKTFSKMDNTILVLPSVRDACNKKARHHLTSSKSAKLEDQLQAILQDVVNLRKGAVMFDAWRKKPVFIVADLIAILADNPRANEICGQAQKKCRYCWCPFATRERDQNLFMYGPDRTKLDFAQYSSCYLAYWRPSRMNPSAAPRGAASRAKVLDTLSGFRIGGASFNSLINKDPGSIMPVEVLHTILLGLMKYMAFELFR